MEGTLTLRKEPGSATVAPFNQTLSPLFACVPIHKRRTFVLQSYCSHLPLSPAAMHWGASEFGGRDG